MLPHFLRLNEQSLTKTGKKNLRAIDASRGVHEVCQVTEEECLLLGDSEDESAQGSSEEKGCISHVSEHGLKMGKGGSKPI